MTCKCKPSYVLRYWDGTKSYFTCYDCFMREGLKFNWVAAENLIAGEPFNITDFYDYEKENITEVADE